MTPFTVAYAPERAQYCVQRADGMRVYPVPQIFSDPDAGKRAAKLAEVLNRMEGAMSAPEPTPDIPPDYCAACDLAVHAVGVVGFGLRCPECGAQLAESSAI